MNIFPRGQSGFRDKFHLRAEEQIKIHSAVVRVRKRAMRLWVARALDLEVFEEGWYFHSWNHLQWLHPVCPSGSMERVYQISPQNKEVNVMLPMDHSCWVLSTRSRGT